jgi:hypothetical protein
MAIDRIVQGKKAAGQSKQPAEKSCIINEYYSSIHSSIHHPSIIHPCMNAYSASVNIIHSSTHGLFTDSFVKTYWLFIHPVLGLFIYSRLMAMLIHCQAERKRNGESVSLSACQSTTSKLQIKGERKVKEMNNSLGFPEGQMHLLYIVQVFTIGSHTLQ